MKGKEIIKDYFVFSRKERNAAITLVVLMAFFISLPYWYPVKEESPVLKSKELQELDSVLSTHNTQENGEESNTASNNHYPNYSNSNEHVVFAPFPFNPNTITAEEWKKFGLKEKTIHTILNYLSKGGKFITAEDIKKIWGITNEEAERIIPYIRIPAATNTLTSKNNQAGNVATAPPSMVDINTATIDQLKLLPGIGNGLQFHIVKYREKLGAFVSIDQLKQTYGMTDSAFQLLKPYLKIDAATIPKQNINTASEYDLCRNPNIERNIAKAIVLYRQQHGNYNSIEDLKKIAFIKEAVFQKIAPYLKAE